MLHDVTIDRRLIFYDNWRLCSSGTELGSFFTNDVSAPVVCAVWYTLIFFRPTFIFLVIYGMTAFCFHGESRAIIYLIDLICYTVSAVSYCHPTEGIISNESRKVTDLIREHQWTNGRSKTAGTKSQVLYFSTLISLTQKNKRRKIGRDRLIVLRV